MYIFGMEKHSETMKTLKKIFYLVLSYAVMTVFEGPLYAQNEVQTLNSEITCTAECPVDGSMWMGTNGEGLYRLGKNGNKLHFSAESGKIGSDYIIHICFDKNGRLWVLDKSGSLTSYTHEEGFKKTNLDIGEISKAILLPKEEIIMIAGVTKFFAFDTKSASLIELSEIPFRPNELRLSSDSSYVWMFGDNKVAKLNPEGTLSEVKDCNDISNSKPLEFETYAERKPKGAGISWIIVICLSVILLSILFAFLIARIRINYLNKKSSTHSDLYAGISEVEHKTVVEEVKTEAETEPETEPEKPAVKPAKERVPVTKFEPKNTEFTTRVMMLIQEHISEPDFDVEKIAELTGMSRIHVNRKLKAEGSPSPSVLIKERRMDMAKYLLLQGEISMSQIASKCGFRSPSYFTTAFKDYTGLTPTDFVAQNRL